MYVKKISDHKIPVQNIKRAWRFYHEVFDMPNNKKLHLTVSVNKKDINFYKSTYPTNKKFSIWVRDDKDDVINHFKSYYVNIINTKEKNKVIIKDDEGNTIIVFTNQ